MKKDNNAKTVRKIIIILAVLLIISAIALAKITACRYFRQPQESFAVVSDNVITPGKENSALDSQSDKATSSSRSTSTAENTVNNQTNGKNVALRIYRNHAEDSAAFQTANMFPGDSETGLYYLEVSYKGIVTVHFHADIHSGYEKLAEVLKCRISVDNGEILYDGLMRDMPQSVSYILPSSSGTTETYIYNLTVYLDTSVGNEYMSKELYADFKWWVDEDSTNVPTVPTVPSQSTEPDRQPNSADSNQPNETINPTEPGELIPSQTGGNMHICIWFWIAMASILLNIILLFIELRRKAEKQEEANE